MCGQYSHSMSHGRQIQGRYVSPVISVLVRPIQTRYHVAFWCQMCELNFLDGWWPVLVKRLHADGKWTVLYEQARYKKEHKVTREKLRQSMIWDGSAWLPSQTQA